MPLSIGYRAVGRTADVLARPSPVPGLRELTSAKRSDPRCGLEARPTG